RGVLRLLRLEPAEILIRAHALAEGDTGVCRPLEYRGVWPDDLHALGHLERGRQKTIIHERRGDLVAVFAQGLRLRIRDADLRQRLEQLHVEHRLVVDPLLQHLGWWILREPFRVEATDLDFAKLWMLILRPRLEAVADLITPLQRLPR